MPSEEDQEILDQVAALSHLEPPAACVASAMNSTRAALLHARTTRVKRYHLMRIAIPSSIAACLLAAALLVWFVIGTRTASAADQLHEAQNVTAAYKGWICETFGSPVLSTTAPATLPKKAGELEGLKGRKLYINTVDGSFADVTEFDDGLKIEFCSIPQHQTALYDRKTGDIVLHTFDDNYAKSLSTVREPEPQTATAVLDYWKKQTGKDPFSISKVRDGQTDRFDIVLFATIAEAEKYRIARDMDVAMTGFRLWVDERKLLIKWEIDFMGGSVTWDISYDLPAIHNIYEAGAPRTAKIRQ